ncbi:aminoglycoside phosphotransferase [Nocardiopsis metallicus]|uniref:Aminoglycoside phosphotransferase n=2 Tax=Nocardiopsis metallicus TaxID=179819 RepID=A0A840W5W7_9ACTN|nr:aminoglycoside phosphotransferase [Nocardiopsis metallicus]MBB5491452.1 hypothetical protein [Nocardiopsis metallicus]
MARNIKPKQLVPKFLTRGRLLMANVAPQSGQVKPIHDIHQQEHEDVLLLVERWLGVELDRSSAAYGNTGSTVGFRTNTGMWVRIQWRRADRMNGQSWTGAECASVLTGVSKPQLRRSVRWQDEPRDAVWRADEMTLVKAPVIAENGSITTDPQLGNAWWSELKKSLTALASHSTDRVGMGQAHLTRRLTEVFGDAVDTHVDEWGTAHADLHWGNLTAAKCHLLDWEDWGAAPRGYDAATLWGFSLGVPSVADRVQNEFRQDLCTRAGRLSQLLFCANVLRAHARSGKTMPFTEPARHAADSLISQLRAEQGEGRA